MSFKTVTDLSCDVTITIGGFNKKLKKDNPTQIEGYYLGRKEIADDKKKSGKSYLYTIQTPKGNVGVWGRTDLDRKISTIAPGTAVRISAAGTAPSKNGDMYKYKVEADTDNTIEVSAEQDNGPTYNDSDEDSEAAEQAYVASRLTEEDDDQPSEQDEDDSQTQALLVAERKAKVEALLKGKLKSKT